MVPCIGICFLLSKPPHGNLCSCSSLSVQGRVEDEGLGSWPRSCPRWHQGSWSHETTLKTSGAPPLKSTPAQGARAKSARRQRREGALAGEAGKVRAPVAPAIL